MNYGHKQYRMYINQLTQKRVFKEFPLYFNILNSVLEAANSSEYMLAKSRTLRIMWNITKVFRLFPFNYLFSHFYQIENDLRVFYILTHIFKAHNNSNSLLVYSLIQN